MRRILSLWFPNLPIERWASLSASGPEAALTRPLVLTVEGRHGQLIHAATPPAIERGARRGGRLTDARALDPALEVEPADLAGEAAWLRSAARWAGQWSPLVELDGSDALRLDVTGLAHLFGGEAALVADIERRFAARGVSARAAISATAGAAWALAHYGSLFLPRAPGRGGIREVKDGGGSVEAPSVGSADSSPRFPGERQCIAQLLAPLPVAALRLSPLATRTLIRLGLKTIGDLAGVPRRSLARRFGKDDHPLDALDRALGRQPEPLTALPDDPPPRSLLPFKEPVTHPEAAGEALGRLVPRIATELQRRQLGARDLALLAYRVDGTVAELAVSTSIPTREPAHLHRLLAGVLERRGLDPGFGIDAFALEVRWWERLASAQETLGGEGDGEASVAALVDRLSVKLGPDKVRRPAPRESHLPERAARWGWGVNSPSPGTGEGGARLASAEREGEGSGTLAQSHPSPFRSLRLLPPSPRRGEGLMRPTRLLDTPEEIAVIYATPEGLPRRFVWRRKVHDIARAQGPQRIAPEWWRSPSTTRLRDYYKVEDSAGTRFWIFREGVVGDGRGGAPLWFVHGLFA